MPQRQPEILFRNGTVFDGRRFLPSGTCVRVRALASPASAQARARTPGPSGRRDPPSPSTWRAACCSPGSSTRTCTRLRAGLSGCAATCRTPTGWPTTSRCPRVRAGEHPDRRGSPAAAGPWTRSPAASRPGMTSTRRAGPAGVPAEPRRPRRLGEQPGPATGRDRHATPRTRLTGGSSASRTASPPARLQEGAMGLVERVVPRPDGRGAGAPASSTGPAVPARARASPAGRTPSSATARSTRLLRRLPGGRRRGLLTARVVGALWWDRERGPSSSTAWSSRRAGRAAAGGSARPASRSCRTACRELHRRDARAVPGRARTGDRPATAG